MQFGRNSYGALFTGNDSTRRYAEAMQTDKDIIAMAMVRNVDGYITGAIADQDGMVYTVRI